MGCLKTEGPALMDAIYLSWLDVRVVPWPNFRVRNMAGIPTCPDFEHPHIGRVLHYGIVAAIEGLIQDPFLFWASQKHRPQLM